MEYKVWYNYVLFRLGIRKVLPRKFIARVKICENGEELVLVDEKKVLFGNGVERPVYLRRVVYDKVCELVNMVLKDGYQVKILDAYRSLECQKRSWEKRVLETKMLYPNASDDEIVRLTSYEYHLRAKELAPNTISFYMKRLRQVIH